MPHTGAVSDPTALQHDIIDFLSGTSEPTEAVISKARSCMRCYGCLDIECPIEVNSLMINELISRTIQAKNKPQDTPLYLEHEERLLSGATEEERKRITSEIADEKSEYLFFPGCNVYKQPDKLLNALDIMDAIGNRYSFAPGMTYCCGSARGQHGNAYGGTPRRLQN